MPQAQEYVNVRTYDVYRNAFQNAFQNTMQQLVGNAPPQVLMTGVQTVRTRNNYCFGGTWFTSMTFATLSAG